MASLISRYYSFRFIITLTITNLESKTLDGGETQDELYFDFVPKRDQPKIKFGMNVTVLSPSLEAVGKSVFYDLLQNGYMMICYENNQLEPMEMGNPIVGPAQQGYEELVPGK